MTSMAQGVLSAATTIVFGVALPAMAQQPPETRPAVDTAHVVVTQPTVIAYLVVPAGAVDTNPELAVLADDWNVAMATLGDSLIANGIRFALVTEPRLRVRSKGARDAVFSLNNHATLLVA
jgi:hypothetical protein